VFTGKLYRVKVGESSEGMRRDAAERFFKSGVRILTPLGRGISLCCWRRDFGGNGDI